MIPIFIGKFYKEEVIFYLDDMEDCHIQLGKFWRCKVQGFYDLKHYLYLFLWEGKRIAMIPYKDQIHVPITEVKVGEKMVKVEVLEERKHVPIAEVLFEEPKTTQDF